MWTTAKWEIPGNRTLAKTQRTETSGIPVSSSFVVLRALSVSAVRMRLVEGREEKEGEARECRMMNAECRIGSCGPE